MQAAGAIGRLGARETYAYAAGELSANMTWNMYSGFILFYYTDVALLPVAAAGTLLLLTRILDAVVDPMIGIAVDRTRTRFGRARPWLIGATLPFTLMTMLSFSVPDWSTSGKVVFAYVTFTLAGILFSAVYIPYSSLLPLMTSDAGDKLRIGSLRAMAASVGSIIIFATMLPLVHLLGGTHPQRGFTLTAALMGLATAAGMLLVFACCRERPHDLRGAATERLWPGLVGMVHNPVWLIVTGFALAMFIRLGALVSVTAYFATDILKAPWAIGLLLSSLSVSLLLGGWLARPVLARYGKRRGNIAALSISFVFTLAMLPGQHNIWLFAALYFFGNITLGIQSATVFVMIADAVDAQERQFGARHEGLLTSSVSFATKVGMAAGGAVTAFGLALVRYDPHLVTQAARSRISLLYFLGPAVFALLQIAIIARYTGERGETQTEIPRKKELLS